MCFFFFFSSRRRHTRFDCDWSSDVCSSDLMPVHSATTAATTPASTTGCSSGASPCSSASWRRSASSVATRSEEHTSELQSQSNLVCRLLLEKKKRTCKMNTNEHKVKVTHQSKECT